MLAEVGSYRYEYKRDSLIGRRLKPDDNLQSRASTYKRCIIHVNKYLMNMYGR